MSILTSCRYLEDNAITVLRADTFSGLTVMIELCVRPALQSFSDECAVFVWHDV